MKKLRILRNENECALERLKNKNDTDENTP